MFKPLTQCVSIWSQKPKWHRSRKQAFLLTPLWCVPSQRDATESAHRVVIDLFPALSGRANYKRDTKRSYTSHTGGCAWKKQAPVWRRHGGQTLHSSGRTTYQSPDCRSLQPKCDMTTSHLVAAKRKQTPHGRSLRYPNKPAVYVRTYLWLTKPWHRALSPATPSPSWLHKCWEVGQREGVRS